MKQTQRIVFLLILCMSSWSFSQEETEELAEEVVEYTKDYEYLEHNEAITKDTASYELQKISKQELETYQNDKRYHYKRQGERIKRPRRSNWLSRGVNAFFKMLSRLFHFDTSYTFLSILKYLLLFVLLVTALYFILKFFGVNIQFRKNKNKQVEEPSFEELEKNLQEVNFDQLIEQSIKNKTYRITVRLLFLRNLQTLANKNYIAWEIDKTNNEYKYELPSRLRKPFEEMIYLFEHIWYGHFELEEDTFEQVIKKLRSFETHLS